MDDGSWLSVAALAVLLACAIFFAAAETAFASASRARLKARQDRGDPGAKRALYVLDNIDRAITTILIGTNITHLTAAAVVTVLVTTRWGAGAAVWGAAATTLVLFLFGEMLPKSVAKKYSERLCLRTAGPLCFFMRVFGPLARLLAAIGEAAARHTKGDGAVSVTEDELYDIVEDMSDAGRLDEEQAGLVQNALEFGDITVEHVLTARVDMAAVDASWPADRITAFIREQRHSRMPVYEEHIDNIIGVLQIRRYIRAWLREGDALVLRDLLDAPFFVPATAKVDDLLPEMSRKKQNMAIVTDAWGGTLGVVTVEDILEELVGEIYDEEDEPEELFRPLGGGRYELDAGLDVAEAFELLDFDDPEDDETLIHKSLNEWALEHFPLLPSQRDSFTYHGLEFTLSDVRRHRIRKLTARRLPDKEGGETT